METKITGAEILFSQKIIFIGQRIAPFLILIGCLEPQEIVKVILRLEDIEDLYEFPASSAATYATIYLEVN